MRFAVATAPKHNSLHWTAGDVSWADICSWVDNPAKQKEAGNYLLGTLRPDTKVKHDKDAEPCVGLHRRKDFVISRSAITLDVDYPKTGFPDTVELLLGCASLLHTTFSSSPDAPRYRLILPTDREMAPDEYVVAAQAIVNTLGADQFDPSTTQPERYMFKPAAKQPEWFESWINEGSLLNVDTLLAEFEEDLSAKPTPKPHKNKRNPYDIEGTVGAFNRAYADDWDALIAAYDLPYEKVNDDRYQLVGARSVAGMGPIREAEGLVFSHHSNDPAYGKACSAFDLVRLHLYGELDEAADPRTPLNRLPSYVAMCELAVVDARVLAEMVGVDFDAVMDGEAAASEWKLKLERSSKGKLLDTVKNRDLLKRNDPVMTLLRFNEMTLAIEFAADPPWRSIAQDRASVTTADRYEIMEHFERDYGIRFTKQYVDAMVDTQAIRTVFNPVKEYLETLTWDGVPRVETCLPGVATTPYTRLVARKCLVAAVARTYDPGCKWDHVLVLQGDEGLGKSWWIDKLAKGFSSKLGRIDNKDTLLAMQYAWILVADEGHSLRKADADAQKEFLTQTSDLFRMPYDRETQRHARHCVIWSTTNDRTFLPAQEGNRRFLVVECEDKVDFTSMSDAYIDQLWAEAVYLYRGGESLYLDESEAREAEQKREWFVEEDTLAGIVEEYVETLVPEDWWAKSPEARRQWRLDRAEGFEPPGTERLTLVCSSQIWVEALGNPLGQHRKLDLLDITRVLKKLPGWEHLPGRHRLPGYGPQVAYQRKGSS